jgi:hypothetical protein
MRGVLPDRSWQEKVDVQFKLTWLNCFWLILPLLAWNLVYGPKLTDPRITSDANSPAWLLIAENINVLSCRCWPVGQGFEQGRVGNLYHCVLVYLARCCAVFSRSAEQQHFRSARPASDAVPVFPGDRANRGFVDVCCSRGGFHRLSHLAWNHKLDRPLSLPNKPFLCLFVLLF